MVVLVSAIHLIMFLLFAGLSFKSCADAVGEPHHGHLRFIGLGHRTTDRVTVDQETIRTTETPHLTHHDEEHLWTRCLPAYCHLQPALCWSV